MPQLAGGRSLELELFKKDSLSRCWLTIREVCSMLSTSGRTLSETHTPGPRPSTIGSIQRRFRSLLRVHSEVAGEKIFMSPGATTCTWAFSKLPPSPHDTN